MPTITKTTRPLFYAVTVYQSNMHSPISVMHALLAQPRLTNLCVRTLSMVSIYVSIQYYICFKHHWQPLGRRRVRCFPGIHHHVSFVRSKMEPLGFIIIIRPSCFEVKCCPWARSAGDMPYLCAFAFKRCFLSTLWLRRGVSGTCLAPLCWSRRSCPMHRRPRGRCISQEISFSQCAP